MSRPEDGRHGGGEGQGEVLGVLRHLVVSDGDVDSDHPLSRFKGHLLWWWTVVPIGEERRSAGGGSEGNSAESNIGLEQHGPLSPAGVSEISSKPFLYPKWCVLCVLWLYLAAVTVT